MNSILIIKHGALGDVVRTSYLLGSLKRKYKDAHITWVTRPSSGPLLKFNPFIDTLFFHEGVQEKSYFDSIDRVYDWVISLDDEFEACYFVKFLRFKKISGAFFDGDRPRYTDDVRLWFDMGLISELGKNVADNLKKENTLGHAEIFARMLELESVVPRFFNDPTINRPLKEKDGTFHVGLNLSAGKRWPSKSLKIEEARKLISGLLEMGLSIRISVIGGQDDLPYNLEISHFHLNDRVALIPPTDLLSFAGFISGLDLLITSDSLALHLAISQKVPTVSFYSPTSAVEIDTFGAGIKIVSTSPDYCSYRTDADNSSITAERILSCIDIDRNSTGFKLRPEKPGNTSSHFALG